ncbi:hypothetical protein JAAARDRAFT_686396 [Jaapia argillacea MUCL 33604]|uniref:NAD(P)-binding protein n=1 Tax=Jaapia argillacea MUCL 33604 TaxID=933084 RepID=A0A067Q6S1_9AGAM|nr:hypothetical protein JAAARDRAFT_686396 [Jaapia argillacea MUCL 33604]
MASRPILVVAGVGTGAGTGGSAARLFSKAGYRVALIARNASSLQTFAASLNESGGDAHPFPISSYTHGSIHEAFTAIKQHWSGGSDKAEIRAALWNAGPGVFKPFLSITEEEVKDTVDTNVIGGFAFARESILSFKENGLDAKGKRGTLLFTGATASLRGNVLTSAFAAGKWGIRALSQSLAKEFGKENIHVAHAIIDGGILTGRAKDSRDPAWVENEDVRLNPDNIAEAYLYLVNQDRSAWTWELDLRPAHEKW